MVMLYFIHFLKLARLCNVSFASVLLSMRRLIRPQLGYLDYGGWDSDPFKNKEHFSSSKIDSVRIFPSKSLSFQ